MLRWGKWAGLECWDWTEGCWDSWRAGRNWFWAELKLLLRASSYWCCRLERERVSGLGRSWVWVWEGEAMRRGFWVCCIGELMAHLFYYGCLRGDCSCKGFLRGDFMLWAGGALFSQSDFCPGGCPNT